MVEDRGAPRAFGHPDELARVIVTGPGVRPGLDVEFPHAVGAPRHAFEAPRVAMQLPPAPAMQDDDDSHRAEAERQPRSR